MFLTLLLNQAAYADDNRTVREFNPSIIYSVNNNNLTWIHQHGLWLVTRFRAIQRLVEEIPPIVSQALPTLCGSQIPPETNQGRPRILAEALRFPRAFPPAHASVGPRISSPTVTQAAH